MEKERSQETLKNMQYERVTAEQSPLFPLQNRKENKTGRKRETSSAQMKKQKQKKRINRSQLQAQQIDFHSDDNNPHSAFHSRPNTRNASRKTHTGYTISACCFPRYVTSPSLYRATYAIFKHECIAIPARVTRLGNHHIHSIFTRSGEILKISVIRILSLASIQTFPQIYNGY